ncbi:hypothetical protein GLOTRDRAFT_132644 [Gloeophyllum trabeum ATCC 11539]|uniref:Amidohydrolase-related domain-containing protein n=1 Tax=Gloeophyllum trabeum (strain ATCC 11539 / FP-39264 / Madison 617) TaxID=670483 RepID=S7PWD4_GLOTA|nr:uncharacterized protein GLOTRDRAFT_132644 [Gloeophyllum trabeum ATCC 11539]EPQ51833.1 hypothetical protein GLOTRDRAFT_132644 [Gloeophyllum trabeum ATCC 11539]
MLHEAADFGFSQTKAEQRGYKHELETCIKALKEMKRHGIKVLPGGSRLRLDPTRHVCARPRALRQVLDFTPMEAIQAATTGVAELFMRSHELGKILPGYYADCILVDGNPLEDIAVLQDHDRLNVIVINGRVHKVSPAEWHAPPVMGQDGNRHVIVPDFPEVKKQWQFKFQD